MSRRLKMAVIHVIESLWRSGYSNRKISEALGVHRDTVAKYVAQFQSRPNAPTGNSTEHETPGGFARPGPESLCIPHHEVIVSKLEQGLSAQRIYQDLVAGYDFEGKYPSVRRYVARLREKAPDLTRRMETEPGEEAQVDFGVGAPILLDDGRRRRTWFFFASCSVIHERATAKLSTDRQQKLSSGRWRMHSVTSAASLRRW